MEFQPGKIAISISFNILVKLELFLVGTFPTLHGCYPKKRNGETLSKSCGFYPHFPHEACYKSIKIPGVESVMRVPHGMMGPSIDGFLFNHLWKDPQKHGHLFSLEVL